MNGFTYVRKSYLFHWRTNTAVILGIAIATASLIGALIVGDSMRDSLKRSALNGLGNIHIGLSTNRFFRDSLGQALIDVGGFPDNAFVEPAACILLHGAVANAETSARSTDVNLIGCDSFFWAMDGAGHVPPRENRDTRNGVMINEALATELSLREGDDLIVYLPRQPDIPVESLLGRGLDAFTRERLPVLKVVHHEGMANFSFIPRVGTIRNVWIRLDHMQRMIEQPGRVNTLLIGARGISKPTADEVLKFDDLLRRAFRLDDAGLSIRVSTKHDYFAVESRHLYVDEATETKCYETGFELGLESTPMLAHLANSIEVIERKPRDELLNTPPDDPRPFILPSGPIRDSIPYSSVLALPLGPEMPVKTVALTQNAVMPRIADDEILLNEWAAAALDVLPGDRIRLRYFADKQLGAYSERTAEFTLRGIIDMTVGDTDADMTPEYPGMTDAERLADWESPFPMDMSRIADDDETYWDNYRATPKAFVTLRKGQELWSQETTSVGQITSLRIHPQAGDDLASRAAEFEKQLTAKLDPARFGLVWRPLRSQALAASTGNSDFGGLFIGFNLFVIVSALLLAVLVQRLSVLQRAEEIGLLTAIGIRHNRIRRWLTFQGVINALVGGGIGVVGAAIAGLIMVHLLSGWLVSSMGSGFLEPTIRGDTMLMGTVISLVLAVVVILPSGSRLLKTLPGLLMRGGAEMIPADKPRGRISLSIAGAMFVLAATVTALSLTTDWIDKSIGFFLNGTLLLIAAIAAFAHILARAEQAGGGGQVHQGLSMLTWRNAARSPSRSLTTMAVIASATFIVAAVGLNRHGNLTPTSVRTSGSGGYTLLGNTIAPVAFDLNTETGRDELGVIGNDNTWQQLDITMLRISRGEDASCLNPYQVNRPTIIGAPPKLIDRGGFSFAATQSNSREEEANPWLLLNRKLDGDAVPAIADANTVNWLLHLGLGKDFVTTDDRGRPLRLRFVALLSGSVLQSQIVISDSAFRAAFPDSQGFSFFLIDAPPDRIVESVTFLEQELGDLAFDAVTTEQRLREYHAIESTYMGAFQLLGAIGLGIGTLGLYAIVLRNILERRKEIALMRAVGWRDARLIGLLIREHAGLLACGIGAGLLAAIVSVTPYLLSQSARPPLGSVILTLAVVTLIGLLSVVVSTRRALRQPLNDALRGDAR